MKRFACFKLLLLAFTLSGCSSYLSTADSRKSLRNYTVVLSMDGFRWDYPDTFPTPNLHKMAKVGVKATAMVPSFPSVTFPNHYTMATGLYPDHHGIVHNSFYDAQLNRDYRISDRNAVEDGSFYGGEPIWNTAEKQGVRTGVYFWVGSEADVQGMRPSYWKKYDEKTPFEQRVDTVIHWLSLTPDKRPELIMFYFDEPDHSGHHFGPFSPETRMAVMHCDSMVGLLLNKASKLPYFRKINFIVTSDHGMETIQDSMKIVLSNYVSPTYMSRINGSNPVITITPREGYTDSILNALQNIRHLSVWKKDETPESLHFGSNVRIDDLVIAADSSWSITMNNQAIYGGAHGYDPANTDMHAIFFACGPDFKKNYRHPAFRNIHLYLILAKILSIHPVQTDGDLNAIKGMLR
ncbi:MAG: alkaline phosphatase family protein [Bacteroidales bacterium]|nr:alkaline phosphatase family protein [Bacteroidales bacterium]